MKVDSFGQSPLLFLEVVKILKKRDISYAVIGAFAASFYGVIRASIDIDAIISINKIAANINDLLDDLKRSGYKITFRMGDQADPIGAVINVEDKYKNRVDLLMNIRSIDDDVFKRSVQTSFMDQNINIIGLEDFIAMKIFAGSPKDLNDVRGVIDISGNGFNSTLLKKLLTKQGSKALKILDALIKKQNS